MDNVLVDFPSAFQHYSQEFLDQNPEKDEIDGIFAKMLPMPNAIESIKELYKYYNIYFLSTAPWNNPSAWKDKLEWVQKYLPIESFKSLMLSHNKNLNIGEYLIDDRLANGAGKFEGEHIHFGTEKFPDWEVTTNYLISKIK